MNDKQTGLTEKETLFIREYCQNGFNGTQAAIKAGYSKKTASEIAYENLIKPHIKIGIKDYLDEILGKYKDTLEYEIIETLKLLAFYDPAEIITDEGGLKKPLSKMGNKSKVINGIQTTYNAKGKKQKKILLYDRKSALDTLAQYMKLLTTNVKIEIEGEMLKKVRDLFF